VPRLLPRMAKRRRSPIRSPVVVASPREFLPATSATSSGTLPWCNRGSRPLASFTRPGHCSRCQRWLGVRSRDEASESALDQHQMRHAYWVATALGELLEATPRVPEGLMRAAFREKPAGAGRPDSQREMRQPSRKGSRSATPSLDGWLNG